MRALILVAALALSVAACKNNDQTDNTANIDENLTAQNIVSNDVTAIDAVTGDAANMAADVDINFTNDQALDNGATPAPTPQSQPGKRAAPAAKAAPPPASAPATAAATNSTG